MRIYYVSPLIIYQSRYLFRILQNTSLQNVKKKPRMNYTIISIRSN